MWSWAVDFERFLILDQRIGRMFDAIDKVGEAAALMVGPKVAERAREKLGVYQGQVQMYPAWMPLAGETLRRRKDRGRNPKDMPLLETGTMQKMIKSSKPLKAGWGEVIFVVGYAGYGSNPVSKTPGQDYAPLHEIGTPLMPARPVLGPAAIEVGEELKDLIGPIYIQHFRTLQDAGVSSASSIFHSWEGHKGWDDF